MSAIYAARSRILFYIPQWIWKNWDYGKIWMITDGVHFGGPSILGLGFGNEAN